MGPDEVTPREYLMLQYLSHGLSNKEIAAAMLTTEGTVKTQLARIFRRTGWDSRHKAALAFLAGKFRQVKQVKSFPRAPSRKLSDEDAAENERWERIWAERFEKVNG
jgi:DNA-binding CsgD family transcriptional regulator